MTDGSPVRSYTLSWLRGNIAGLFRPETGQLDPNINSDFDLISLLSNRSGYLPGDHRHSFKLFAAGEIPLGGGLIPKAAIAWTGTQVVGASMERLYRLGYAYTREERKSAYHDLFERGKQMAQSLMDMLHRPQTT